MAFKKLKYWFDEDLAILLSDKILVVDSSFDKKSFVKNLKKKLDKLELKDRVELMADALYAELGEDYKGGLKILSNILGPENEEEVGMFNNFYWIMPIAKFVEKYGLDNFKVSMKALEEITKRNTSEYAIRPFIEKLPEKTMSQLLKWSTDKNRHVRRLASEGPRPRLPWATKLDRFIEDPSAIIPILNNLKDDQSKYVQKSVANCINDILKDNLTVAKKLIEKWNTKSASKERKWIIKHALRNLLKREDPWACKMIKKF